MADISTLRKKLASYSALSIAALLANLQKSQGQIIYHDISPDIYLENSPFELNLNNDSIVDFKFKNKSLGSEYNWSYYGEVNPLFQNSVMRPDEGTFADPLYEGSTIGSVLPPDKFWTQDKRLLLSATGWGTTTNSPGNYWTNVEGPWWYTGDRYLGLALHLPDGVHYGWMRLYSGFKLKDYAYNSLAGESIQAGQVSNCDTLNVTVSPEGPFMICGLGNSVELVLETQTVTYPIAFKWLKDGETISDSISTNLTIDESGSYRAVIYGYGCSDTSNIVMATFSNYISPPPVITQHLDTLFTNHPDNNSWYLYNSPIPDATENYYAISSNGLYQSRYIDSMGCPSYLANFNATTCANTSVEILNTPTEVTICSSDSIALITSGNPFYSQYQWYEDNAVLPGSTNSTLNISSTGTYNIVITGYQGCTDTSENFILEVISPLATISTIGDSVLISNQADSYQWYFNGLPILNAINQTYTPVQSGSYQVEIIDSNGCKALSDPYNFIPTSQQTLSEVNNFEVWINDHQMHIRFTHLPVNCRIILFNEVGIKLTEISVTQNELVLPVHEYPAGIYFVAAVSEASQLLKKIVND